MRRRTSRTRTSAGGDGRSLRAAYAVLLRGGRRQLLRPSAPLSAAVRGVRDGHRLVRPGRDEPPAEQRCLGDSGAMSPAVAYTSRRGKGML